MKKFTSKQKEICKEYWKAAQAVRERYWRDIGKLETALKTDIKIDAEFFHVDGDLVGIGDYERKYKLLHDVELE